MNYRFTDSENILHLVKRRADDLAALVAEAPLLRLKKRSGSGMVAMNISVVVLVVAQTLAHARRRERLRFQIGH